MLLEIIIALFVGVLAGTFTGIFPGIHINLVAAGLLALLSGAYFSGIAPIVLVVFVVAMAITHTFIDFIPSIFLGAPDEDSFLAVLPGHELLREGKGYEAVVYTLYGSLIALPIILLFTFVFIFFLGSVYDAVSIILPYVLIFVSLYLVFSEEEWINAIAIFILAGFLGLTSFNLPVKEPLLPLLTGLFGVSSLIVSLKSKVGIPKQKIKPLREIKLGVRETARATFAAGIAAPLCSFLPGIGSGHASIIGSELTGNFGRERKNFLFLVGAINTIVMALSFVTAYAIGKTRTGAAVAVKEILGEMTSGNLFVIILVVILSGLLAFVIGVNLGKVFSDKISKVNYGKLSLFVIGLLIAVNLVLSNFYGLIVLATASALGVFCIQSRVRRIQLMGVLLIPTIVFYLTL